MPLYKVQTVQGELTVEAEDEDQARRLGRDGGRNVLSVEEITDADADEAATPAYEPVAGSEVRDAETGEPIAWKPVVAPDDTTPPQG